MEGNTASKPENSKDYIIFLFIAIFLMAIVVVFVFPSTLYNLLYVIGIEVSLAIAVALWGKLLELSDELKIRELQESKESKGSEWCICVNVKRK